MAEYIERRALWKRIARVQERRERDGQLLLAKALDIVIQMVEREPAADVAPVVRGRWVSFDFDVTFSCSECGFTTDFMLTNYCPKCGAKLDAK